jgi:hypothetical protein
MLADDDVQATACGHPRREHDIGATPGHVGA